MGLKEWIVPQDRAFFDRLDAAARNVSSCAQALHDLISNYGALAEKRHGIKDMEHRGDQITHDLFEALGRRSTLLRFRDDIAALAHAFDDIVDYMYAATNRLYLYEITKATPEMRKFTEILVSQAHELEQGLQQVRSSKTIRGAVRHCIETHRLENEADRLLNEAVATLFRTGDAIHIMKHKEIYEMMETATDKCEDVADVLADIVRKHG